MLTCCSKMHFHLSLHSTKLKQNIFCYFMFNINVICESLRMSLFKIINIIVHNDAHC